MDARSWISRFAEELGVDAPDDTTVEHLLRLAATAAHSSERMAAPIACYLVGLAGRDPAQADETARALHGDQTSR